MTWEQSKELVESDVVQFVDPIWPINRPYRKKVKPWGKQTVVAQITAIEGEFVKLTVLKAAVTENRIGSDLRPHKVGTSITKKRSTLLRGTPERLHWSEEDVRAALIAAT